MSDAEQRAWAVVRQAYEERSPTPRRSRRPLVPVLAAAAVVVGAAIATPPGHAVFQKVREAVGVQHAEPALFSLPSHGRLLVTAGSGSSTTTGSSVGSARTPTRSGHPTGST
jgi:hypothetical protein